MSDGDDDDDTDADDDWFSATNRPCICVCGWLEAWNDGWLGTCVHVGVGVCLVCGDCADDLGWNREGADGDVHTRYNTQTVVGDILVSYLV